MAWLDIISKDMLMVNAVQLALNEEGNNRTVFFSLDTPDTYEIKPSADNTAIEARATVIFAEWQAEYDSQEYARLRQNDYPSIQECVHAMLDGGLDELQAKRQEVKTRFPK
jgi:hypothetical protein